MRASAFCFHAFTRRRFVPASASCHPEGSLELQHCLEFPVKRLIDHSSITATSTAPRHDILFEMREMRALLCITALAQAFLHAPRRTIRRPTIRATASDDDEGFSIAGDEEEVSLDLVDLLRAPPDAAPNRNRSVDYLRLDGRELAGLGENEPARGHMRS